MSKEIDTRRNLAPKKRQKSGGVKSKGGRKFKNPKIKSFKKLYVYYCPQHGTFSAWHNKLSSKNLRQYFTFAYEVSIRAKSDIISDIVGRIASGIEFGNDGERWEKL